MALVPASTVPRRLNTTCVTNFYPIHFQGNDNGCLHIHIFHCYFYDVDAEEAIRPREETELKRRIFEAPRQEGRQRDIEDALGVRSLEFGGDCAAGLRDAAAAGGAAAEARPLELVPGDVDRYEANYGGDWLPAVIRNILDDGNVSVELYAPGSFWSEMLNRTGPFEVPAEALRPRQWEVYRGEVLRVPDGEVLTLHAGQHLWVRSRGPGHDEPAGRLAIGLGSGVRCEGGTVENEGMVESIAALQHPQHGLRRYKVEIESIKTLLVDCMEGVPDLPQEERSVVLQCFTWIFERAYRHMQMRTLGGRGWYLAEEGETYPRQLSSDADQTVPPRVFLYRGFAVTAVQVVHGPCLKVDLSVRMIQGQTALAKLNFFRDLLIQRHQSSGSPPPTKEETEAFLQLQMVGRTCMTRHNHIHYRISRVCIDMDPLSTFPFDDGEITYMEYFQRRHGIALQRRQPMLHCPFRGKHELYLPAELAFLTGLDDDWKADREFAQELWRGLRHDPTDHWRLQSRLTGGLASEEEGLALREWGVAVEREPIRVKCGELEHEPVYFGRLAEEYFRRALLPPPELEVPTSRQGFERKPWPEVWAPRGHRLHFDRWLLFCSARPEERQVVERFVQELEPLVGEILEGDLDSGRIVIAPPELVAVPAGSPGGWVDFVRAYRPPWPQGQTKFAFLVIPDKVRRRDQYYYQLKDLLSFQQEAGLPSQMVLSSTLQRTSQRQQIWKNILQQMLIKRGAWLWVISPLPYRGRSVMVIGIDACRQSKESPSIQTLCGSTNPYFTSYYTTWRTQEAPRTGTEHSTPPGALVKEAVLRFFRENGRLPDSLVVYRAGVSERQESTLLESEVHHPSDGLLEALAAAAQEVALSPEELGRWRQRLEVAYILVRRGTNARFRTDENENLPSGTYVNDSIVTSREEAGQGESKRFDFYLVSQTYVIGTAKPTLYSVLYNTLKLSRYDIMQLTYRLCAVYMTFSGMVSMPAPLKYAAKLLSLLSKCESTPPEPTRAAVKWKPCLFFV